MTELRALYYTWRVKRQCDSFSLPIRANGHTCLNDKTRLGKNANFNGLIVKGGGSVEIGENFHSGENCLIITQNHNYDEGESIPYDATYIYKDVIIGDNVWLGDRVIILGGVTIGEGAVIQAGSVVVSNVPPLAVAGGHPAKVFKSRNSDHYYKLKAQEKFLWAPLKTA